MRQGDDLIFRYHINRRMTHRGMLATNYRELVVYQSALKAAHRLFECSRRWPAEERYVLVSQVRRSSRSVCANIAEAWRKRIYPAAFVSKLSDADAEAAETMVWLEFAREYAYVSAEEFPALYSQYDTIGAQLVTMIRDPLPWCRRARGLPPTPHSLRSTGR